MKPRRRVPGEVLKLHKREKYSTKGGEKEKNRRETTPSFGLHREKFWRDLPKKKKIDEENNFFTVLVTNDPPVFSSKVQMLVTIEFMNSQFSRTSTQWWKEPKKRETIETDKTISINLIPSLQLLQRKIVHFLFLRKRLLGNESNHTEFSICQSHHPSYRVKNSRS